MPRMRTMKPDAATSESLARVGRDTRWTFAVLWTHCDDEGRALRNYRLIKAAIYPLDDEMTPAAIESELTALAEVGCLCFYEVDGKEYLHVPSWSEHQHPNRKVPSKLPVCPKTEHTYTPHERRSDDAVSPHTQGSPVVVVGDVDGVVVGEVAAPQPAPKRGTRLKEDWRPTDETREWTLDKLTAQAAATELEKFRNHWLSKTGRDATKLDWNLTWRNWVLNSRGSPSSGQPANVADDHIARAARRLGVAQ